MGVWTLLVTIGVPVSPFIFGFVALRVNYRWIYYILAITNAVQFILYAILGPETRYMRKGIRHTGSTLHQKYFDFKRIDPTPLTWRDFVQPLGFAFKPCVVIPAITYSMIFLFGSVLITIEIPQLFPELFHFNTEQVGLQFLGLIIGSILGEQIGGFASDKWMAWRGRRTHSTVPAEFRLWLSYPGFLLTICGIVVFMIQIGHLETYNVTPVVGAGIAAAGNQIVTTIMITYAVDCYREEAASVGVFITFVRQIWGFIGPFWFPQAIVRLGFAGATGLMVGLMVAASIAPAIFLQWRGGKMR
jgi:MFS family permease